MSSKNLQNFETALLASYVPVRSEASQLTLLLADPAGVEPTVTVYLSFGRLYDLFPLAPAAWLRASESLQDALTEDLLVVQTGLTPPAPPAPAPASTEGSAHQRIRTIAANYTVQADDYTLLVDASAGAVSITLPSSVNEADRLLVIKKIDVSSNNVTILPGSGETIDGEASYALATQNESVSLHCNGQNFFAL
jgi:hypothetical protein